ncbi:iron-sulfur cluster repair di-iron protein [Paenibacillus albiflavus]|uniref:Iron-sulfur cluster repair di-iron protein n=1 Tax=Paenibacillus albiflavus TaxID=2545760 RepID=A0A4R4EGI7_9BACL|nr:iron-sulfur cluster repair di-iron protein [Paenibacillus albiflavus]TCZ78260.1 iron-sulfur cluster repair di-iron protein [Paenibacillus albiflavus]
MNETTLQTQVADIVTAVPQTADLFRKLRIDYCCGGKISLQEAALGRNLDPMQVLTNVLEIEQAQVAYAANNLQSHDEAELIEYIQSKYHAHLREELAQLPPYVTKLARVHGGHSPHLLRVQELFEALRQELLEHTAEEEEVVFPLVLQYVTNPVQETSVKLLPYLLNLEEEHDKAGHILKELRDITHDFMPPDDACGTYRLVYHRLSLLEKETFEHIHLENHVLFDQVRAIMPA